GPHGVLVELDGLCVDVAVDHRAEPSVAYREGPQPVAARRLVVPEPQVSGSGPRERALRPSEGRPAATPREGARRGSGCLQDLSAAELDSPRHHALVRTRRTFRRP